MSKILCVTGTGTEVGKTAVSLAILLWAKETGLRAGYVKLVQCGSRLPDSEPFQGDAEWIEAAQPGVFSPLTIYSFQNPVSPHLAAEKADAWIDPEWIQEQVSAAASRCDLLVVEGAGGAAAPFARDGYSLAELAAKADWPCLIAGQPGLGALHQTRTAAHFLVSRGARIAGFVMSQSTPDIPRVYEDNVASLKVMLPAPYFGLVPFCPGLHKRLPLPPAMALMFARSLGNGLKTWWSLSAAEGRSLSSVEGRVAP